MSSLPGIVGVLIGSVSIVFATVTYLRGIHDVPLWPLHTLAQVLPGNLVPGLLFAVGIGTLWFALRTKPPGRSEPERRLPSVPKRQSQAPSTDLSSAMIARLQESSDPEAAHPTNGQGQTTKA